MTLGQIMAECSCEQEQACTAANRCLASFRVADTERDKIVAHLLLKAAKVEAAAQAWLPWSLKRRFEMVRVKALRDAAAEIEELP